MIRRRKGGKPEEFIPVADLRAKRIGCVPQHLVVQAPKTQLNMSQPSSNQLIESVRAKLREIIQRFSQEYEPLAKKIDEFDWYNALYTETFNIQELFDTITHARLIEREAEQNLCRVPKGLLHDLIQEILILSTKAIKVNLLLECMRFCESYMSIFSDWKNAGTVLPRMTQIVSGIEHIIQDIPLDPVKRYEEEMIPELYKQIQSLNNAAEYILKPHREEFRNVFHEAWHQYVRKSKSIPERPSVAAIRSHAAKVAVEFLKPTARFDINPESLLLKDPSLHEKAVAFVKEAQDLKRSFQEFDVYDAIYKGNVKITDLVTTLLKGRYVENQIIELMFTAKLAGISDLEKISQFPNIANNTRCDIKDILNIFELYTNPDMFCDWPNARTVLGRIKEGLIALKSAIPKYAIDVKDYEQRIEKINAQVIDYEKAADYILNSGPQYATEFQKIPFEAYRSEFDRRNNGGRPEDFKSAIALRSATQAPQEQKNPQGMVVVRLLSEVPQAKQKQIEIVTSVLNQAPEMHSRKRNSGRSWPISAGKRQEKTQRIKREALHQ